MNLYLLRHGLATEPGEGGITRDSDRPLTVKGERRTGRAGEAMRAMDLSFDLILTSPYKRARQTAEIIADALDAKERLHVAETLAPGGNSRRLIESINRREPRPGEVLLVGHEPGLSELISVLVFGDATGGIVMKKGGLCKLEISSLSHSRCARLQWLLTAQQLCSLT